MGLKKLTKKTAKNWMGKESWSWWQAACIMCGYVPPETLPVFLNEMNKNKKIRSFVKLMQDHKDCPAKAPDLKTIN